MAGSPNDDLLLTNRLPNIKTKTTAEEETAMRTTIWEGEPLSPASQLFHDPSFNCHIICIFGLGTPINNIDAEDLQATLVRHPCFLSIPTVNDVLVGVTSAALSKFLYRKHCETKDEKEFPTNTCVRSTFLVNIRSPSGINALEDMMKEGKNGAKYGNRIGYFILRFPIIIHEDPLEYVRQGKTIATRKKNSLEAVSTYFNAKLIVKLFGTKVACALSNKVLMNTTLSFSNLMGPLEQICFSGHPIVYIAPSVYGHAHALTVHCQSYMNMMKVVMAVDDSVISDSHQLLDNFVESLSIIRDAAENLLKTNLN